MATAGKFAEHCQVHLFRYGTPRQPLEDVIKNNGVMLLDVDVQGAEKLKKEYPEAITVFVLPPSIEALRQRLTARGTETQEQLKVRFENATDEMKLWGNFEYVVINDDLDKAINEVQSIVTADGCRTDRFNSEQIKNIIG
jgi:guanylate kinase